MRFVSDQRAGNGDGGRGGADAVEGVRGRAVVRFGTSAVVVR
jgi:hypothetical protein